MNAWGVSATWAAAVRCRDDDEVGEGGSARIVVAGGGGAPGESLAFASLAPGRRASAALSEIHARGGRRGVALDVVPVGAGRRTACLHVDIVPVNVEPMGEGQCRVIPAFDHCLM